MGFSGKKPKEYTKAEIEELNKKLKDTPFEKGDQLALFLAALKKLLPPVLIFLGLLYLILYLLFIR